MGFDRAVLGRTGLAVCRLGLGGGYGMDQAMIEEAAAAGVNYFYWGAMRTRKMAAGLRALAARDRAKIAIAAHASGKSPRALARAVHECLDQLGVDHLDVLVLGNHTHPPSAPLMEQALGLKAEGLVRHLALSSHRRAVFPELEAGKQIDLFHVRYNAVHRGAETEIFDRLPAEGGPGIVSFLATRWGGLLRPGNMPSGEKPPTAVDCYRFALSHPRVHVALSGPNSMEQLKENLRALEVGPMDQEELERMRCIGDHVKRDVWPMRDLAKSIFTVRWRG